MPTIKKISSPEDYSTSIDYLSNYSNYEEMFLDYFKNQSHTIYNFSHALSFFPKNEKGLALSIGTDIFKELSLVKNSYFESIEVWEIEEDLISIANNFVKKLEQKIKFVKKNILHEQIIPNKFNTLLLFQMDYIFSDENIKLILAKAQEANVKECFIISPSILHIEFPFPKEKDIFAHDLVKFISLFFESFSLKKKIGNNNKEMHLTYTRTLRSFKKLIKKSYFNIKEIKVIMNSNGSFHLIHLKK